jgi:hypothetical protein
MIDELEELAVDLSIPCLLLLPSSESLLLSFVELKDLCGIQPAEFVKLRQYQKNLLPAVVPVAAPEILFYEPSRTSPPTSQNEQHHTSTVKPTLHPSISADEPLVAPEILSFEEPRSSPPHEQPRQTERTIPVPPDLSSRPVPQIPAKSEQSRTSLSSRPVPKPPTSAPRTPSLSARPVPVPPSLNDRPVPQPRPLIERPMLINPFDSSRDNLYDGRVEEMVNALPSPITSGSSLESPSTYNSFHESPSNKTQIITPEDLIDGFSLLVAKSPVNPEKDEYASPSTDIANTLKLALKSRNNALATSSDEESSSDESE